MEKNLIQLKFDFIKHRNGCYGCVKTDNCEEARRLKFLISRREAEVMRRLRGGV